MSALRSAPQVLDQVFLEVRAKLLEIAATLDRIERADAADEVAADPRLKQIHHGLEILNSSGTDRAERILRTFGDDYDPDWDR